jgi:chloramphenicol-sensitive protein RarD
MNDHRTPITPDPRDARIGLFYGLAAYLSWGMAPAYYRMLGQVTPMQILAHRIFWSVVLLLPLVAHRRLWSEVGRALRTRRTRVTLIASTLFISVNWYTFIYSISVQKVVQASLGYYMNPLVVVLLGVVFLKERLRAVQLASLALAGAAVAILTYAQGELPVISLILAVSFGVYGLLRKQADVGAIAGLFIETLLLAPICATLVGIDLARGPARSASTYALLAGAGVITAIPLIWFANAARRLRLATMGLLQYLAPTCSFLLAVGFFGEAFTAVQRIAFPMIWVALVLYSIDSYRAFRAAVTARAPRRGFEVEPVLSDL